MNKVVETDERPSSSVQPENRTQRKLKIFGPNLKDQSKGSFVIHAADCADCGKLQKLNEVCSIENHDSALSVSKSIWSDMINEGSMTAEDGLQEIHFEPCVTFQTERLQPEIVKLTKAGVDRVLNSCEGMMFRVKSVTQNGDRRIVHVIDDRHEPEAIWSLGPEHYETLDPQPVSNHTPRATRKGEIHVGIERGGFYRGLFQVWNPEGNELTADEEAKLRDLFASAPALLRSNGELLEAIKGLLICIGSYAGSGHYPPSDEPEIVKARAAIRNAEAVKESK